MAARAVSKLRYFWRIWSEKLVGRLVRAWFVFFIVQMTARGVLRLLHRDTIQWPDFMDDVFISLVAAVFMVGMALFWKYRDSASRP